MNDDELEAFVKISDENGEISKNDIIIQVNKWMLYQKGSHKIENMPQTKIVKILRFNEYHIFRLNI